MLVEVERPPDDRLRSADRAPITEAIVQDLERSRVRPGDGCRARQPEAPERRPARRRHSCRGRDRADAALTEPFGSGIARDHVDDAPAALAFLARRRASTTTSSGASAAPSVLSSTCDTMNSIGRSSRYCSSSAAVSPPARSADARAERAADHLVLRACLERHVDLSRTLMSASQRSASVGVEQRLDLGCCRELRQVHRRLALARAGAATARRR